MSTLKEVEKIIEGLPREELLRLIHWIAENAEKVWKLKSEEDIASDSLDEMADRAKRSHLEGNSRPLPA